ncbi:phage tail protein [Motilimonas sp. 1_MG-2023]|uniref:phage tail protein n=1 Tax=Motilimonas sp. 1_MG-2023 TaxID=3062672 RepID=UPI0026E41444|nr:phage tail protein [Motilimonas sp. 1_MG-2023]MDO6525441.1 phage tail protein [Motilimonas sp. 1_MG-2023]
MNKPEELRALLLAAVPHLARNPSNLQIFIEQGKIVATGAGQNLSFEYQCDVIILATDYAEHADTLIVPLMAWVAKHQPELLTNPDKRQNGVKFRAELISKKKSDIEITIPITERVLVTPVEGGRTVKHLPEPLFDPYSGFEWKLFIDGEQVPTPEGSL